ncbi:minor capsid protein [Lapidilactobacillus mulanensis]|uniref:Minor capsid protein n=1 Tax=Lapidilactobacillus mulanensis TaxID=2485999 RepID=A0ABW4DSL1_9LACO|nr:minor capsid protein [Lapidilactobacillus mulanensis]
MDFPERLVAEIRKLNLPIKTRIGNVGTDESAGFYPMPGGQVITEFMDGMKEQQLNYEYVIKSKDQDKAGDQLWAVSNFIEELDEIPSLDGSYDFEEITITSKPAQSQADEQGFFYWVVDFSAQIITYKKK